MERGEAAQPAQGRVGLSGNCLTVCFAYIYIYMYIYILYISIDVI